jgi:hypothetical protein
VPSYRPKRYLPTTMGNVMLSLVSRSGSNMRSPCGTEPVCKPVPYHTLSVCVQAAARKTCQG